MRQIVNPEQYKSMILPDNYNGTDDQLNRLLVAAQLIVDTAVSGRLSRYDNYPAVLQERIVTAICFQTEYIIANGGSDYLCSNDAQSVTLGSFSYSSASGGGTDSSAAKLCALADTVLRGTGLMYGGVDVVGD